MTARDPYWVLGIDRATTFADARAAYRRLVEIYHPDRFQEGRPEVRAEATRRLEELNLAWEEVRVELGDTTAPAAPAPPADQAPTGMSFATDQGAGGVIFDAEIQAVDAPQPLHVRWAGPPGRAVLRALMRMHRTGTGAVQQVDWGAFELVLPGSDARRFLEQAVLAGGPDSPVSVVEGPRDAPPRLSGILDHLDTRARYRIYAENF